MRIKHLKEVTPTMTIRTNKAKGKVTVKGDKPAARVKLRSRDHITPEYAWRVRQEALEYALEVCLQCIVFGLGDPKPVGGFHADLHGGVFAAESFVGWLPGGCVAVAFGRVG